MIAVYAAGVLIVLGILALLAQPFIGVAMIGAGYWLYQQANHKERYQAASLFWGLALAAMAIVTVAALFSVLFG